MTTPECEIQVTLKHVCEKNVEIRNRLEKCLECCKQSLTCDVSDYALNPKDLNSDRNVNREGYAQEVSDGNKQPTGDQTSPFMLHGGK